MKNKLDSNIFNFREFNEAMSTLSDEDNQEIEDLCLYFSDKWNLSFEGHEEKGYISIQRFDKFFIQFGVQLNKKFNWELDGDKFEMDLRNLIKRIEKFGYDVHESYWNAKIFSFRTFTFQISHTNEKSKQILIKSQNNFN